MKKHLLLFITIGSLLLCSWGVVGHKTITQIAENHLSLQTKNAIKSLLGNQSLTDVSSWGDQVRQQPEYKNAAPWHFLNVQMGLNYQAFVNAVKSQNNENVYTAVIKCEQQLADVNTPTNQKIIALKFIIHLIGDMHQHNAR